MAASVDGKWELSYGRSSVQYRLGPTDPLHTVVLTSDGGLKCSGDNAFWCTHIEQVVRENWDSKLLWREGVEPDEIAMIRVPIVPSMDLWATVRVGGLHVTGAYQMFLVQDDNFFSKAKHATVQLHFLGFHHQGEGRAVLRGMIYDWFRATIAQCSPSQYLKCRISAHNMGTEMRVVNDLKKPTTALAQQWSIFMYGTCTYCKDAMTDMEDLVPF